MEIHIETFTYCNAKCVFCGYQNMTREKGTMSGSMFKNIINQIGEMNEPVYLKPAHYNEFFLDSRWFEFLKYIDENAPKTIVHIPTNCSCLTDENVDKLITIKTFKEILFSVYSFNPSVYTELIGLPSSTLDLVKNAITKISEKRPDVNGFLGFSFELLTIEDIISSLNTAIALVNRYQQLNLAIHPMVRYGLNKSYTENAWFHFPPEIYCDTPCSEPFTTMTILHNGDVCGCCFDVDGEVHLGSIKNERLIDIWNGDKTKKFRDMHTTGRRNEIKLCRDCSQPCDNEAFRWLLETSGAISSKGGIPFIMVRYPPNNISGMS